MKTTKRKWNKTMKGKFNPFFFPYTLQTNLIEHHLNLYLPKIICPSKEISGDIVAPTLNTYTSNIVF